MNTHLSKKQLIALAAENVSRAREASYRAHLESCQQCRAAYEKLRLAQEPYYRQQLNVSGRLKTRILNSMETAAALKRDESVGRVAVHKFSWPMVPAAAIITLFIAFLVMHGVVSKEKIFPFMTRTKGYAAINGVAAMEGAALREGARVMLKNGAFVEISGRGHRLYLMGPADITVEKAGKSTLSLYTNYIYRLNSGTMVSIRDTETRRLRMQYRTPAGVLYSRGTRFMVELTGQDANVYLFSGSLSATDPDGKVAIDIKQGTKLHLPAMKHGDPISEGDRERARAIEMMDTRATVNKQRKAIPYDKEPADEGRLNKTGEKAGNGSAVRDRVREKKKDRRELNRSIRQERREIFRREKPGRN